MAIIKCKACSADLHIIPGESTAICEYCGVEQTVPNPDNEKKMTLFTRAHRLRAACDFDKAAAVYESIVAEFTEEAEAYWGLVLCKYGIEYVDDTATGRKVPTCHRSSFDSVLDDPNYEQAMECADDVAAALYRQEAKLLENIRKKIIEVSSREEGYDIFICYKETDPKTGDRTPDSVLAQDIYRELTHEGYRVFFSRITLETHLGENYEPYIFAALNSSKIMLAVGTTYVNFHSTWVVNEWSRYLKLIAAGQQKTLIPCYKDIDIEDLPKEFQKLQGQNFNKLGAMQDLVHGVEKILPLQKAAPVQEKIYIQNPTGTADMLTPILQRGAMALEDFDWNKADSFYEKALNMDAQCAEAYLGKFLLQNKVRSLNELLLLRKKTIAAAKATTVTANIDRSDEADLRSKYYIPDYLPYSKIDALLAFDSSFPSTLESCSEIYNNQLQWVNQNKDLARARKYATGKLKDQVENFAHNLLDPLEKNYKAAHAHFDQKYDELTLKYEKHLQSVEDKLIQMHKEAEAQRQEHYENLCLQQENATTIEHFRRLVADFSDMGTYKEARQRADVCSKRCSEIQAAKDAEAAKKAAAQKAKEKRKAAVASTITTLIVLAVIGAVVFFLVNTFILKPQREKEALLAEAPAKYAAALKSKDTVAAAMTLGELANLGYEDSAEKSLELWSTFVQRTTFSGDRTYNVAAVNSDGTVSARLHDYTDQDKSHTQWTDIVSITSGYEFTVALKADGTVESMSMDKVADWKNIVAIAAGDKFVAGLQIDGTVIATGELLSVPKLNEEDWTNIVSIVAADNHLIGLKADGTVVAAGENDYNELNVQDWTGIVKIATGDQQTVGLKADGTVVVACSRSANGWKQQNAEEWKNIVDIACTQYVVVGLYSDGTLALTHPQHDVSSWGQITAIEGSFWHILGLQADGTLLSTEHDPLEIYNVRRP